MRLKHHRYHSFFSFTPFSHDFIAIHELPEYEDDESVMDIPGENQSDNTANLETASDGKSPEAEKQDGDQQAAEKNNPQSATNEDPTINPEPNNNTNSNGE